MRLPFSLPRWLSPERLAFAVLILGAAALAYPVYQFFLEVGRAEPTMINHIVVSSVRHGACWTALCGLAQGLWGARYSLRSRSMTPVFFLGIFGNAAAGALLFGVLLTLPSVGQVMWLELSFLF